MVDLRGRSPTAALGAQRQSAACAWARSSECGGGSSRASVCARARSCEAMNGRGGVSLPHPTDMPRKLTASTSAEPSTSHRASGDSASTHAEPLSSAASAQPCRCCAVGTPVGNPPAAIAPAVPATTARATDGVRPAVLDSLRSSSSPAAQPALRYCRYSSPEPGAGWRVQRRPGCAQARSFAISLASAAWLRLLLVVPASTVEYSRLADHDSEPAHEPPSERPARHSHAPPPSGAGWRSPPSAGGANSACGNSGTAPVDYSAAQDDK